MINYRYLHVWGSAFYLRVQLFRLKLAGLSQVAFLLSLEVLYVSAISLVCIDIRLALSVYV